MATSDADDSTAQPYPYVYVNNDGTARELHPEERRYLETRFHPADGARPYIKSSFEARDGWGDLQGYCPRSKLLCGTRIAAAPAENPHKPMTKEGFNAYLRSKGMTVIENPDGTIELKSPRKKST